MIVVGNIVVVDDMVNVMVVVSLLVAVEYCKNFVVDVVDNDDYVTDFWLTVKMLPLHYYCHYYGHQHYNFLLSI